MIGKDTFIVAELSANHHQDYKIAAGLVYSACAAGADAVKVQMFKPEELTLDSSVGRFYIPNGLWAGRGLIDLYRETQLPWEWIKDIGVMARGLGLKFIISVFGDESLAEAERLEPDALKIASFECVDPVFVEKVASKAKTVIASFPMLGYQKFRQLKQALKVCNDWWILHCCNKYPSDPEDINLRTLLELQRSCNGRVGFSDHTRSTGVAVAAMMYGARIIEKHLTLDQRGPDGLFSIKPEPFRRMVRGIRDAEKALGCVVVGGNSTNSRYYRTLFACKPIRRGELFSPENIRSVRAVEADGADPALWNKLIGQPASRDYRQAEPIREG